MEHELIDELIRRDESQTHERKRSLSLLKEGFSSLCGMVNADAARGTVLFGVDQDGEVVGVEAGNLDKAQRSISQQISTKFEPRLQYVSEVAEIRGKRLLVLSASRNREIPYYEYDGRAFMREGSVTRQLSLEEKQSLQRKRRRDLHNGPWRCDRCGSWVGTLISFEGTDQGMRKTYRCECGGEFWPVA